MTERIYGYTRGNCGYAGGYVICSYSYALFRPMYTGYCDCGWNTGQQYSINEAENLIMNHATSPRWGLLAYSLSLRDALWTWGIADLASAERTLLSSLPAPDAQVVVRAYDTLVAFVVSEKNGGWAWRNGNVERHTVQDAVKACKQQYGKSRLLVLFNTVSGTIIDNRF